MPQNPSLEQALLSRPQINGPMNLPQGDPNAPEAQILRFMGGLVGNQQPGDLPSALGATTTLSLPFLSKLAKLLPRGAAAAPEAIPELAPSFRANMHEFEPVTTGQRPAINDEAANFAFSQMQRSNAGKRPVLTIEELNGMLNSPRHPEAPMRGSEVMKRMADLKQYRDAAAQERMAIQEHTVIPFPLRKKEE